MIELLFGNLTLPPNPLLPEPEPIIITEPELTLEQKIAQNVFNCDGSIYYIREDTAECLLKPVQAVSTPKPTNTQVSTQRKAKPIKRANKTTAWAGYYEAGSCTDGAFRLAPWIGRYKNANTWARMARAEGRRVDSIPAVGAVFVDTGGRYGHVGVIIAVNGNTVTTKEMNYKQKYVYSSRTVPASSFVYIHP